MTDHIGNRAIVVECLRRELVGPAPAGREIDVSGEIRFTEAQDSYGPWRQVGGGEEILARDSPVKRYGVGVLYPVPRDAQSGAVDGSVEEDPIEQELDGLEALDERPAEVIEVHTSGPIASPQEADTDDFDLSLANAYQPSSMGVSFLADLRDGDDLVVEVTGGRYSQAVVIVAVPGKPERKRIWWLRYPVRVLAKVPGNLLRPDGPSRLVARYCEAGEGLVTEMSNVGELSLQVEVITRPHGPGQRLLTVCLVNRSTGARSKSEQCLFQAAFSAEIVKPTGDSAILPYPGPRVDTDLEEESFALLYRGWQAFATGHGCSADWILDEGADRARAVRAESLPVTETPTVTPDITRTDGSPLVASMVALGGLDPGDDGFYALDEIVSGYERWIKERRAESDALSSRYRQAGHSHMIACAEAAARMRAGLEFLQHDARARRAFRLANHAVLLQQLATQIVSRDFSYDVKRKALDFVGERSLPDVSRVPPDRGLWRAFQIGFLLMSLRSSVDGDAADRRTVELLWFPTGGGKTEAYLGLAAFSAFMRRLKAVDDCGVHVLMRYTLRLLTAQQFQRASSLLCAMEHLRRLNSQELGSGPFSTGIWLGGDTTPNKRSGALKALRELERSKDAPNPFVLGRCPWCGAKFGRVQLPGMRGRRGGPALTPGYARHSEVGGEETVALRCPDGDCEFASGLPVYVIDEDIYQKRPTLVIGTVDKFAMLAWEPKARSLFGLNSEGERVASPPGLIIQDELHLIAGPLGSLAGLYETVIEELATDYRSGSVISPKIVCSTATIRRFEDQIRALYARERVALFPPPGLDASDSFFARHDRKSAGRIFVGVHAVSLGSVQTEWVRTFTALLQAPMPLDLEGRDPWWTLLVFFNSIREMGTAHTLFQSDVPDYAKVLCSREGIARDQRRYLSAGRIFELTGGLPSDEIMEAIAALEIACTSRWTPKDVCLASSVIEVGIDIPRLSLMVVAGQPKTTSQYIQVTGRVGRVRERPGLIVTMYSPSKPRDRSHFERFRAYHERLYAQVEPTSVTPFSAPALDRALHAVMVAHCLQIGGPDIARSPFPYPDALIERLRPLIENRVRRVDPAELETTRRVFEKRIRQWRDWQRTRWRGDPQAEETALLRIFGEYASPAMARLSWPTPTSMRNVDAECEAQITTTYIDTEGADA
ncbi:MAG: helicase-related protein [Acidobacteriota bacterium]